MSFNFREKEFFSLSLIFENTLVPFQPNEISSSSQHVLQNMSLETTFQPKRSKVSQEIIKTNEVRVNLTFLKTSPPDSSDKNTLEEKMISSLTTKMAKSAEWINVDAPSK